MPVIKVKFKEVIVFLLFIRSHLQDCLEISVQAAGWHSQAARYTLDITDKPTKYTQSLNANNFGTVCPIYLLYQTPTDGRIPPCRLLQTTLHLHLRI